MTQPKTQEELQGRVLEVLRREWPDTHLDADLDYRLVYKGLSFCHGYLGASGNVFGLERGINAVGLDTLAEASRLLRDGVAEPSRVDRALEVLRVEFPSAHVDRHPYTKSTEHPAPQLNLCVGIDLHSIGKAYESGMDRVDLTSAQHRAIATALEILNGGGE